ncbi:NUDIX hydrolase [Hungatella hathewayi]|uniref:NUDIX hydrolase n=1 Tax=Hungatella hathewayi TaxID=154046 RepID=UPI003569EAC2
MKCEEQLSACIRQLKYLIPDPEQGVGGEMFEYLSSVTPMINVDLLVEDGDRGILLAWRDDLCGRGWHIPGGVVRYKETFEERIRKVSEKEFKIPLDYEAQPIQMEQVIMDSDIRGHFISFLYRCRINGEEPVIKKNPPYAAGDLKWHKTFPADMVRGQRDFYRKYFDGGSYD